MTLDWSNFTPLPALGGGLLLGLSAFLLLLLLGRIAGISGIISGVLQSPSLKERSWRLAFILGMVIAPLVFALFAELPASQIDAEWPLLIAAGLLVGFGARFGSGCTSGHGVCGLSRLSIRSLVATCSFMGTGFITVFVVRHLIA